MKKFAIFPIILVLIIACITQAKSQSTTEKTLTKTLLYEISGKNIKTSYLLGTFHLLCENDLFVTQVIQDKIKASEQLVLELDFDSPQMQKDMQENMMLPTGKTLKDYLKGQDYDKVAKFFKEELSMPLENLLSFKPFVLSTFLYPKYLDCKTASWEMSLVTFAKAQKIEVLGLETIKQQFEAIEKTPTKIQVKDLIEAIGDLEKSKKQMKSMLQLYQSQDIEALYKVAAKEMAKNDKNGAKYMLDDRNILWIPKIEEMSKEKATFYAVGAGHLGGASGVINLLRKKGYNIKPIENPQVKPLPKKEAESNSSQIKSEVAKKLIRTWKLDESIIPQLVEGVIENAKKQTPEQEEQIVAQKDMIAKMLASVRIIYKQDASFVVDAPPTPEKGSWKLAENDTKIVRTDDKGEVTTNEIIELTDKKLIVLNEQKIKLIYIAE